MSSPKPTLDPSYSPTLGSILDNAVNPSGITVASILVDGSVGGGGPEAMAVYGFNAGLGTWQYQISGTGYWQTMDPILNLDFGLALMLGPADLIRLLPSAGSVGDHEDALLLRAWSGTGAASGDYDYIGFADDRFSDDVDGVSVSIVAGNRAPTFLSTPGTGMLRLGIEGINDRGVAVIAGPDETIVLAGSALVDGADRFGLIRLNAAGLLDTTFAAAGKATVDASAGSDQAEAVAIQSDGKIVVAGTSSEGGLSQFTVSRLGADGTPDGTFGPGGSVTIATGSDMLARAVRIQSDGKLVIAGQSAGGNADFQLVRLNANGTIDNTFGSSGYATLDLEGSADYGEALTLQSDGKMIVGGTTMHNGIAVFSLVRLTASGLPDATFGTNGQAILSNFSGEDLGEGVTVLADGRILIGGTGYHNGQFTFSVARLSADGQVDPTFGVDGRASVPGAGSIFAEGMAVQADGKILIAGTLNSDYIVARLDANGAIDPSFGQSGIATIDLGETDTARSITVQADGKILIAGTSTNAGVNQFSLVRLNADGSLDTSLGEISTVSSDTAAYTENAAPVALDNAVTIYDAELSALDGGAGNFNGASITLSRAGGANASDVFSGLGPLALAGASGNAVLSGVTIGTFVNGAGTLSITFNSNATQARVNSALSSFGYSSTSDAPAASVKINYTFNDGNIGSQGGGGAGTTTSVKTVNISALNDSATGAVTIDGQLLLGQVLTANTAALADADGLGVLHYSWLRNGSAFGAADAPTYTLTQDDVGATIAVRVTYVDAGGTHEQVVSADSAVIQAPNAGRLLRGTPSGDWLWGGAFNDTILGLDGHDFLDGNAGNDSMDAGLGNDFMYGGEGDDILYGGGGNDYMRGGAGRDSLYAGEGNDLMFGDDGDDLMFGQEGHDTLYGGDGSDYLEGHDGNDLLDGGDLADTLSGGIGNDRLLGKGGNDSLVGGDGNDTLDGGAGNDALRAGAGDDSVLGGAGDDVLVGGLGRDTLNGGAGKDLFVFDALPSAGNADTIVGFNAVDDTIQLARAAGYLTLPAGALAASAFVVGAAALDGGDRVIYNAGTGALLYDADGTGFLPAVTIATLTGVVVAPTAADFWVV